MIQQPAKRKYDDDEYGHTGFWYFHWPLLRCVFRTDYPNMKFNPEESTEELTFHEFVQYSIQYNQSRRPLVNTKPGRRYYCDIAGDVFVSDEPVNPVYAIELMPAEYLAL